MAKLIPEVSQELQAFVKSSGLSFPMGGHLAIAHNEGDRYVPV
jgi:hypothetical protein